MAGLVRVLLALLAVWLVPLSMAAVPCAQAAPPPPPAAGPDLVTVGVFVNDIEDIDIGADTFTADILVWMRWRNPAIKPWETVEVMNASGATDTTAPLQGGLGGRPILDAPQVMPDGSRYMGVRYHGVFSRKMNLEKYPFDTQNLRIILENKNQDTRSLQFVPDTTPITISRSVTNPGYTLGTPTLQVVSHTYETDFGDISAPADRAYSRIVITIPVERDFLPYLVKIVLPILILIVITSLIYVLPPRLEEARAGLAITAMLTIVAMQWTTDSSLPSVGYLTLLDLIYILSMLYILGSMTYTVIASRRNRHKMDEAAAKALDRRAGIIAFSAYMGLLGLAVLLYLTHHHVEPGL